MELAHTTVGEIEVTVFFHVELSLRYTRISCMPYRAKLEIDRVVQATDQDDALRQACLCLDRDLEELLAHVNTINVSDVLVDVRGIRETEDGEEQALWNAEPFAPQVAVPRYIIVQG